MASKREVERAKSLWFNVLGNPRLDDHLRALRDCDKPLRDALGNPQCGTPDWEYAQACTNILFEDELKALAD
jgi:hypothetical protein